MISLWATSLIDSQRPTFVVNIKIYQFIFRLGLKFWLRQAVALHCMLHYERFMFPASFRDQLNGLYFPLSAAHRVSEWKIYSKSFRPLNNGFLNGRLLWNLWRMDSNCWYLRKSNYFTWSRSVPKMFGYKNFILSARRQSVAEFSRTTSKVKQFSSKCNH